jgi:hypothetical protein
MSKRQMFSILSTNAPLVEVIGDGPTSDLSDGLTVPDGTVTIAPARLNDRSVRRWRVDAPPNVRTSIVVCDSPFGAFVGVRRSFELVAKCRGLLSPGRWPRLLRGLKRSAPTVVALWHLFFDEVSPRAWQDVHDGASHQALAQGGDIITVTFVVVQKARRHA